MDTTTCVVLCLLIIAWATVKICEIYYKSARFCGCTFNWQKADDEEKEPIEEENNPKE